MEKSLQQFLEAGLAPSTRKVYIAGWNRYFKFANALNLPPQPISIDKVTLFVAFLGSEGLAVSTIESYLAALRHYRVVTDPSNMAPSFHSPHMSVLLRGIRRTQALKAPPRVRLPITSTLLRRIKSVLAQQHSEYQNVLTWAACCTGFFGFLRCGEFLVPDGAVFCPDIHLSIADVAFQASAQQVIYLNIKVSKTDQYRQGSTVALGSTGADLCPVAALLDYLALRGKSDGPLFRHEDGSPFVRHQFTRLVQQALSSTGLDGAQFNGHSFRIGAATTASAAGVPDATIKLLGRWKSHVFEAYIRTPPTELAKVSQQLAKK